MILNQADPSPPSAQDDDDIVLSDRFLASLGMTTIYKKKGRDDLFASR